MQLQQLDYVLAVVDEGSFTAAARSRGVTQPSLSQGVRALEAELGVDLFVRAGRPVRLTAAGEAFVEPARRAVRVGRFRRAHPGVRVRITEPEDPDALVDEVRTGASELGFAQLPVGEDLEVVPLESHDYVAIVPPGGERGRLRLAALADAALVTTPPGTST